MIPANPPATPDVTTQEIGATVATITGDGTYTVQAHSWRILSKLGESIFGSITRDQAQGIREAISAVRPAKSVPLPNQDVVLNGEPSKITTWNLTQALYEHKHYALYKITNITAPQQEELTGYINVETPIDLDFKPSYQVLAPSETPAPTEVVYHNPEQLANVTEPDSWLPQLPATGFGWLLSYGDVYVYDDWSDEIVADTTIYPGETQSVMLPPGYYSVEAELSVFGYPFYIDGGSADSPLYPVMLSVTFTVGNLALGILGGMALAAALVAAFIARTAYRHLTHRPEEPTTAPQLQLHDAPPPPPDSVLNDIGKVSIADMDRVSPPPQEQTPKPEPNKEVEK